MISKVYHNKDNIGLLKLFIIITLIVKLIFINENNTNFTRQMKQFFL